MESISTKSRPLESMTVAVVDQHADDYADLLNSTQKSSIHWQFVSTGHEALRLARMQPVDLWMVNTQLPDMSGLDLCTMLKSQLVLGVIYVVTDEYNEQIEREARICGATLFGCKPVQPGWIDHFCMEKLSH